MQNQNEPQTPAKAIAAALVPLAAALGLYISTGVIDTEEISLALAGLISGLLVFLTSNAPKRDVNARR